MNENNAYGDQLIIFFCRHCSICFRSLFIIIFNTLPSIVRLTMSAGFFLCLSKKFEKKLWWKIWQNGSSMQSEYHICFQTIMVSIHPFLSYVYNFLGHLAKSAHRNKRISYFCWVHLLAVVNVWIVEPFYFTLFDMCSSVVVETK